MKGHIAVVDDVPAAFAEMLRSRCADRSGPYSSIAFSGGSTARDCYERVAALPRGAIDWSTVDAWWGDERCVPLDDPASNHRLVHEALLDRVDPVHRDHPMLCGPTGADDYDALLAAAAPLDVIHLGLGPDGHTASLFPGSTALDAPADRLVVENDDPRGVNPHRRLTFTFAAIARARFVIVTVAGREKRDAFARVRVGDPSAPASRIDGARVVWLVDRDALGDDATAS